MDQELDSSFQAAPPAAFAKEEEAEQQKKPEKEEEGEGGRRPRLPRLPGWPPLLDGHDPDAVWIAIRNKQQFLEPTSVFPADEDLPPKAPGAVRFVCISDTHGRGGPLIGKLPEGDVLLHAGDFSMLGARREIADFGAWLSSLPFQTKVVIAGNHDMSFDTEFYNGQGRRLARLRGDARADENTEDPRAVFLEAAGEGVIYLEDESALVKGVHIYGTPWQPEFCDWAFNLRRGPACAEKWAKIPEDTDILLTHGPPLGRGDQCVGKNRAGCADLLAELQGRVRPAFCVFGHIHEGYGATFDGTTHYVNASSCNFNYRCVNAPLVFDVVPSRTPTGAQS